MNEYEVFHIPNDYDVEHPTEEEPYHPGWYWWWCMSGFLPSSDPYGPYETAEAAREAAEEEVADYEAQ